MTTATPSSPASSYDEVADGDAVNIRGAVWSLSLLLIGGFLALLVYSYVPLPRRVTDLLPGPVAMNSALEVVQRAEPYWCDEPDIMDRYACWVEAAAEGATKSSLLGVNAEQKKIFKALEAMNLIETVASSARYSWFAKQLGDSFPVPPLTEQYLCLANGYGICGNHGLLFLDLMKRVGVEARSIQLWYKVPDSGERANHVAAEIMVEGKWRYFDVTWGTIWAQDPTDVTSVLSLDEVLAKQGQRITAETNVWLILYNRLAALGHANYDPYLYLRGDQLEITRNGGGTVTIDFVDGKANLDDVPNYVGRPEGTDSLQLALKTGGRASDKKPATLSVASLSGCSASRLVVGQNEYPVRLGAIEITVADGDTISVGENDKNCVVMIGGIDVH